MAGLVTVFQEDDLEVSFAGADHARKFDDEQRHGLLFSMKAVDFIVELPDSFLFVEFKDPMHPSAMGSDVTEFVRRFQSGQLDSDFIYKFRDTFLYELASGRANKPIFYLLLVTLDGQDAALLGPRAIALNQKLPSGIPSTASWQRALVQGCLVLNIQTWQQHFPDFPINRISAASNP